ncbi:hypothetical protein Q4574_07150 [Aliiglaciecola sp. 3_MG-2023]|uniref:hypothetical protein n=1 Tax=Aliiglaciecola sp. 3_MG-2023 TaxID=3062644 RepID=UPI0026E2F54F|nr:hypothetical protein [Aliiglaciecola sp. 3_MG-2023]MDO6693055.1 hypothetical protein [Aliiglaciecola sp. 3_MG-2023]
MNQHKVIKGKRPAFYEAPESDYLMHMVMVLAQELSATRDRLDTLEKLSAQKNQVTAEEIESYTPDQATLEEREARRQVFLGNLFSVMNQESAELKARDSKSRFNQVIDDIASGKID